VEPPEEVKSDSADQLVQATERLLGLSIAAARRGAMRAIDPWTGEILQSSCCLSYVGVPWDRASLLGYRFVGSKVFYLFLTGLVAHEKFGIYIPDDEAMVAFDARRSDEEIVNAIAGWRAFLVKNAEIAFANIQYDGERSPVFVLQSRHFAHNLWNELSAVEALLGALPDQKISFWETVAPFGRLEDLFPQLSKPSVIRKPCSAEQLHLEMLKAAPFVVPGVRRWIPASLAARVQAHARRSYPAAARDAAAFRAEAAAVLWITIRTDMRTWIGQVDGFANLIQALADEIPSLSIIFDGFSVPEDSKSFGADHIRDERQTVTEIVSRLPKQLPIKNIVGVSLCEAIVWSGAADYYVAHHGTPQHKIGWIANLPGVVHAGENLRSQIDKHAAFTAREGSHQPTYRFGRVVRDDTRDARRDAFSYELDWRQLFDVVAPDIEAIVRRRS
jgi:hypothetical protein